MPSPTATAAPSSFLDPIPLLGPGDEASLAALDEDGEWGTITVHRGDDTGGYATSAAHPDTFIIEVHVEYAVARDTSATFGAMDWALVTASDRRPVGGIFRPDVPEHPWEIWELPELPPEVTTDLIAVEPRVIDGWLLFAVPRDLADEPLELAYRPSHLVEAVTVLAVRDEGAAPDPVPTATPEPRPATLPYVPSETAGFSVIDDPEADELFVDADTCENPVAGYTLSYPDDWYTNTAAGAVPACSWFSPVFYELTEDGRVPPEIVIEIRSFEGGIGFVHVPDYTITEQVTVDGWNAGRTEEVGGLGADGWLPRSLFTYQYTIYASDDDFGLKVIATTSTDDPGSYERNKAVLDRIIASLRFDR
ncbi:MAG TPA: hypothetical protein VHR55_02015 [Candidatus Limnocylindria bacterium]|nr:hypothetical protein [Candidatus Limnocylindria bacterium]